MPRGIAGDGIRSVTGARAESGTMPADDAVLRSARNAFGVVLVLLFAISTYQFYTIRGVTRPIAVLWVAAAGVFYLSRYYYRRQAAGGAETEKD